MDERPPHEEAGAEVARVLDVDEPRLVLERVVVDRRDVPGEVVGEPDRQRDGGVDRDAPASESRRRRGHRGRDAEHGEERRPLGEDHVLQQVRGEQVVEAEVVERRPERDREQHHRAGEADDAPPRRAEAADEEEVEQREHRDDDGRVDVRLPGVGRVRVSEQHGGLR